ncbi:MAG: hypothetical protein COT73_12215 [Bdellovibrio sp. CG10_big_fil_rev_8_21_14_0_10_47_8]|nr:MAG: hypothetical protein COT73_12215 [Bdellovibrio sp. CG10_big_fil_rev_8_21_14_0_10_47_8]
MKFSPRVQFRYPHYVFIDIESTSALFGGENQILKQAVELARRISPEATGAIADSCSVAQVMVNHKPFDISKPREDAKNIGRLPLMALRDLEGLEPWRGKKGIDPVIQFLQSLGMDWIEDLFHFQEASFRERWGDLGVTLWRRLQGKELQVISPLVPKEPMMGYSYLEDPVSNISLLMSQMDHVLEYLFLRLEGCARFARRVDVTMLCEYSDKKHYFSVEPVAPSRDLELYRDLIIKHLESLSLENPLREFEIYVYDVAEKVEQLDFFEPRQTTEDRWRRLVSMAHQAEIEMGFLQVEASHLPESSFSLKSDWPQELISKDLIEWSEQAVQVRAVYAKGLAESPRPSLLLKEPMKLSSIMMKRLKVLTRFPIERIQEAWWKKNQERDYYFALSNEGQLLWVYQELGSEKYFLHGYFD